MSTRSRALRTQGVAPKTIVAAAMPLLAGLALLALDKLALGDSIDDAVWLAALGLSPAVGAGAYRAPAAPTRVAPRRDYDTEVGTTLIETLIVIFLVLAIVLLLAWLL